MTNRNEHRTTADRHLPFPVKVPPRRHPLTARCLLITARFVIIVAQLGKASLLGFVGIVITYTLISSDVILPTYDEGGRPFSHGEFISFAASFLALGVIAILLDPSGKKLLYLGRKLGATDALEVLERDSRRPVLFLRSFEDDHLDDPTFTGPFEWQRQRYEERLSRALHKLGPVICLGRPGEKYSEAGASRLYVEDEYWQQAVVHFLQESRAVVVVVGDTDSLHWEIETAILNTPLNQLLFFFPYAASTDVAQSLWQRVMQWFFPMNVTKGIYLQMESERQRRYQRFKERFGSLFDAALPDKPGEEQFLNFSIKGEARLLNTRRPLFSAFAKFLQQSFKMHINFSKTLRPFVLKLSAKRTT